MKKQNDIYTIKTAGAKEQLMYRPDVIECGAIKDGIALSLRGVTGWFVISFDDLKHMVKLADAERKRNGSGAG